MKNTLGLGAMRPFLPFRHSISWPFNREPERAGERDIHNIVLLHLQNVDHVFKWQTPNTNVINNSFCSCLYTRLYIYSDWRLRITHPSQLWSGPLINVMIDLLDLIDSNAKKVHRHRRCFHLNDALCSTTFQAKLLLPETDRRVLLCAWFIVLSLVYCCTTSTSIL